MYIELFPGFKPNYKPKLASVHNYSYIGDFYVNESDDLSLRIETRSSSNLNWWSSRKCYFPHGMHNLESKFIGKDSDGSPWAGITYEVWKSSQKVILFVPNR